MPDTFKTRRQLSERALSALGILQAGQDPSAEDANLVDSYVDPMLARLQSRDILIDADPDYIELDVFVPLGFILASDAAPDFGLVGEELAGVEAKAANAIYDLRVITSRRPTYKTLAVDYF